MAVADWQRTSGSSVAARDRLRAAQQPEPVLELHLLPRPPRRRRPVRAGRAPGHRRRARHLPPSRARLRSPRRERRRRAGAARLARARSGSITPRAPQRLSTTREDRVGPDDGRGLRADRDRVDARRSGPRSGCAAMSISTPSRPTRPLNSGRGAVRPRQPEGRRGVRTVGRHRVVRQRRHRLPQQRCARRGRSPSIPSRGVPAPTRHAARAREGRRGRRAHGAREGAAVHAVAVVSRPRLRAAVRRRRRDHRAGPAEPPRRRRVDQLRAADAVDDRGRRPVVLACAVHRDQIRPATSFPARSTAWCRRGCPWNRPRPVFGSLRLRHFGPRPLVEDASVRSRGHIDLERRDRLSPLGHARASSSRATTCSTPTVADIDYFYTSRLPGEPAEGVDDVHTHPAIPRTARLSLQLSF